MKNIRMKTLALSLLAAMGASVAWAKQTLVAEYIVPSSEIDNWDYAGKIFNGYNTETQKGFTFTRRGVVEQYFYNYCLQEPATMKTNFVALGVWIAPEIGFSAKLPEKYTRTITSSNSPAHRYIYKVRYAEEEVPGIREIVDYKTKEMEGFLSGNISSAALEKWVIANGVDSSSFDYYYYRESAPYVQCVHTDYVYTVTLDPNGGDGKAYSQFVTNKADLVANRFARTGYTFRNWNTKANGKGIAYEDGEEIEPTDDMTLYAQWDGGEIEVFFDPNGGNLDGTSSTTVTVGDKYGTLPSASRDGFSPELWYTELEGGNRVGSGSTVEILTNHTLYAHWRKNSYALRISLGANVTSVWYRTTQNGDWQMTTNSCTASVLFGDSWAAYAVVGEGYETATSEANPKIGQMTSSGADFVATASEKKYTITYRPGTYGGAAEYTDEKRWFSAVTLRDARYSRTGYEQTGWAYADEQSVADYGLGQNLTNRFAFGHLDHDDIDLYPVWTPNTYQVQYVANDSDVTGTMTNSVHTYDVPAPLSSNQYARAGYSFGGWTRGAETFADGGEVKNLTATKGDVVRLYAKWTAGEYTLTYDPVFPDAVVDGKTLEPVRKSVMYGETYGDLTEDVKKTGYTFSGWYTATNGGSRVYSWTTVNKAADHSIFAHWTTNRYTVAFCYDDGVGIDTQSFVYDQPQALRKAADMGCEKEGFDPIGWAETPGGIVAYQDGAVVSNLTATAGCEFKLYAVFAKSPAYVAFDPSTNVVTGTMPMQAFKCGETAALASNEFARTGYTFGGWSRAQGGAKAEFADGGYYTPALADAHKTNTLYAVWSPVTNTVTFAANGKTCEIDPTEKDYVYDTRYGELAKVTNPQEGWKFGGWQTEPDGGEPIAEDSVVAITNDATFYANWEPAPFALAFDAQGGAFTNGTSTLTNSCDYYDGRAYGEFPAVTNKADNLIFAGWWDSTNAATQVQQLTNSCASLSNKTLYARWKAKAGGGQTVKVIFRYNDGSGNVLTRECPKGSALEGAILDDPTREGYRFVGWYAGQESGSRVTRDTVFNADATCYARWSDESVERVLGTFEDIAFKIGENGGWIEETDAELKHKGNPTLRGGADVDVAVSTLTAICACENGGAFSFYWAMEDYLNQDRFTWSAAFPKPQQQGMHDWSDSAETFSREDAGAFSWTYKRNATYTDNGAWISGLTWTPNPVENPIAAWTNHSEGLAFETGGQATWKMAAADEGIRSGSIEDGNYSWVRTTATGPGVMSFRWRTNCERGFTDEKSGVYNWTDRLELRVDGACTEPVVAIDGSNAWATVAFTNAAAVAGEPHVYEWRYKKDANASVSEDCAWLDAVFWKTGESHTVTFETNGVEYITSKVLDGAPVARPAEPLPPPEKIGYVAAWKTSDGAAYDFATPVTADLKLHAEWEWRVRPITVSIAGSVATNRFINAEQSLSGWTVTDIPDQPDNPYSAEDVALVGAAEARGTSVGEYAMGLSAAAFANRNDKYDVTFDVTDGRLVIVPGKLEGEPGTGEVPPGGVSKFDSSNAYDSLSRAYDATALTNAFAAAGAGSNAVEYAATEAGPWSAEPPAVVGVGKTSFWYRVTSQNYETFVHEVRMAVTPRDIARAEVVRIPDQLWTGEPITPPVTMTDGKPSIISPGDYLVAYSDNVDIGKATVTLTGTNNYTGTTTAQFNIVARILPHSLVTIYGHVATNVYDGAAHEVIGYEFVSTNADYTAADFACLGETNAVRTVVGTSCAGLTSGSFVNLNPEFNAEFVVARDVSSTVTAKRIEDEPIEKPEGATSAFDAAGVYDGTAHTLDIASLTNAFAREYAVTNVEYAARAEGPWFAEPPTFTDAAKASLWYRVWAENHEPFVHEATVTVSPREVTLKSADGLWPYDGQAHEAHGAVRLSALDFVAGETVTTNYYGERTEVGVTPNAFDVAWGTAAASNYALTLVTGKLEVVAAEGVVVRISGHVATNVYDGLPHSVEGYDVETDSPLYSEVDFAFTGKSHAERTDAGESCFGLRPDDFANTNGNFANVSFAIVRDGAVVVVKATLAEEPGAGEVPPGGVSKFDVTVAYDRYGHTLDVAALEAAVKSACGDDAVVTYAESPDGEWEDEPPSFVDVGEHALWYRVASRNFETYSHEVRVTVTGPEPVGEVGRYFGYTLGELGYSISDAKQVKIDGLPAGLALKKLKDGTYYLEGVPTATASTNDGQCAYLRITHFDKTETMVELPIEIRAAGVREIAPPAVLGEAYGPVPVATLWPEVADATATPKDWTFAGWPTGIKYTTREVRNQADAYEVYGKATKAGVFTVTATRTMASAFTTSKYKEKYYASFMTRPDAESGIARTNQAYVALDPIELEGAKSVSGLPTGLKFKSGTVSGTPTKPGVFAVTQTNADRTKSLFLWQILPGENGGAEVDFGGSAVEAGIVQVEVGLPVAWTLAADAGAKVSVTGLPTGLSYKNSAITGVPTRAGNFTATVTSVANGVTVTQRFAVTVTALPAYAVGTYYGATTNEFGSAEQFTLTLSAAGKVSGNFNVKGTRVSFTAKSLEAKLSEGRYAATVSYKYNREPYEDKIVLEKFGEADGVDLWSVSLGGSSNILVGVEARRDVIKDVYGKVTAGTYSVADEAFGEGEYLTAKVAATGVVTVSGKLADANGKLVSVSCSTRLAVLDEDRLGCWITIYKTVSRQSPITYSRFWERPTE